MLRGGLGTSRILRDKHGWIPPAMVAEPSRFHIGQIGVVLGNNQRMYQLLTPEGVGWIHSDDLMEAN